MFDEIAPVYDRMNSLMTLGLDAGWRRAAVRASAVGPGDAVIDVACGTGKLAEALAEQVGPFGRVLAVDLAPGMIAEATAQHRDLVQLEFMVGDALALPVEDASFDAATIAFGLRNLPDFAAGFRELARVVRPGGRVVCLELSVPATAPVGPHLPRDVRAFRAAARLGVRAGRRVPLPAGLARGLPDAGRARPFDARGRAHGRGLPELRARLRGAPPGTYPGRLTRSAFGRRLLEQRLEGLVGRGHVLVGPGRLERLARPAPVRHVGRCRCGRREGDGRRRRRRRRDRSRCGWRRRPRDRPRRRRPRRRPPRRRARSSGRSAPSSGMPAR